MKYLNLFKLYVSSNLIYQSQNIFKLRKELGFKIEKLGPEGQGDLNDEAGPRQLFRRLFAAKF